MFVFFYFAVARCCGRTCERLTATALRKQTRASNQVRLRGGFVCAEVKCGSVCEQLPTASRCLWAGLCCDTKHGSGCGEMLKKRGSFCLCASDCSSREAPVTAESIFILSPHQAFYIVPPFFFPSLLAFIITVLETVLCWRWRSQVLD